MDEKQQLEYVLTLIRDFRLKVLKAGIHPVITRAALIYALDVDEKVIREEGLPLLEINRKARILSFKLWKLMEKHTQPLG